MEIEKSMCGSELQALPEGVRRVAEGVAAAHGAAVDVDLIRGY